MRPAGFTQRKPQPDSHADRDASRFNEAAGFTQRKRSCYLLVEVDALAASMRPPVLPSGNFFIIIFFIIIFFIIIFFASMRPPVLPSGNSNEAIDEPRLDISLQ